MGLSVPQIRLRFSSDADIVRLTNARIIIIIIIIVYSLLVYEFYIKWINKYGKQFSFSKKLIFYRQVCSRF